MHIMWEEVEEDAQINGILFLNKSTILWKGLGREEIKAIKYAKGRECKRKYLDKYQRGGKEIEWGKGAKILRWVWKCQCYIALALIIATTANSIKVTEEAEPITYSIE